ncbi:NAD(P)-dependent oxidoreductase [Levilactobacillus cerevisiae]|uniref:NAD(P)-dependent oxidoreductase n=1 Tax=Levilactobacillus cerevisiae TaxID=1704076 RepID=UPI000F7B422E|nr:NAD(P)-dependent oxidoreductase [Levilactobacillus cerevisiae]
MKILITDYKESMMPQHDIERQVLSAGLDDCEIMVYEYQDDRRAEFLKLVADVDAILTAFVKLDREVFEHAPQLKVVSINATGYDNVDLKVAQEYGVGVCPVGEYCTQDVAEFTIGVMHALVRNLKAYANNVERNHEWRYDLCLPNLRIENMTLGIVGLGKIGRAVATRAHALGMRVLATDPFITNEHYALVSDFVRLIDPETLFMEADVVTNHMNLNETNHRYFDTAKFSQMRKHPYFINMGRGAELREADLIAALDQGQLKGAAMDVLEDEHPDLAHHPLVGRDNVIVTPHVAFYSQDSMAGLQRISTENIVNYLTGNKEDVFKLVTQ